MAEHRGYIQNKNLEQATGAHFNLPGHTVANMKILFTLNQTHTKSTYYVWTFSCYIKILIKLMYSASNPAI